MNNCCHTPFRNVIFTWIDCEFNMEWIRGGVITIFDTKFGLYYIGTVPISGVTN